MRQIRVEKLATMKEAGVEPFEYTFDTSHTWQALAELYNNRLENGEEDETVDVAVAGRIMLRRVFGKLAFFTIQDETGTIQLQLVKNRLGTDFKVRMVLVT